MKEVVIKAFHCTQALTYVISTIPATQFKFPIPNYPAGGNIALQVLSVKVFSAAFRGSCKLQSDMYPLTIFIFLGASFYLMGFKGTHIPNIRAISPCVTS